MADVGFNLRGWALSQTREYKWNLGFEVFCAPEANVFKAVCSLNQFKIAISKAVS